MATVNIAIDAAGRERLAAAIEERRLDLRLSLREVADLAGFTTETLRKIRVSSTGMDPLTAANLSAALQWTRSSAQRIIDGLEPEPLPVSPGHVVPERLRRAVADTAQGAAEGNGES